MVMVRKECRFDGEVEGMIEDSQVITKLWMLVINGDGYL